MSNVSDIEQSLQKIIDNIYRDSELVDQYSRRSASDEYFRLLDERAKQDQEFRSANHNQGGLNPPIKTQPNKND